jgi:ABC-type transporter Mla subunit MlaD
LLLSQFKPLYNTNSNELTKEGELFELNVSNLRNIESNANNFLKQTIGEAGIEENNARFKSQISVLRDNLKSLDSFIKKIETYKQSLDIAKDKRYKFVPGTFVSTNLSSIESVINNIYGSSEGSSHLYDLKQALIE